MKRMVPDQRGAKGGVTPIGRIGDTCTRLAAEEGWTMMFTAIVCHSVNLCGTREMERGEESPQTGRWEEGKRKNEDFLKFTLAVILRLWYTICRKPKTGRAASAEVDGLAQFRKTGNKRCSFANKTLCVSSQTSAG